MSLSIPHVGTRTRIVATVGLAALVAGGVVIGQARDDRVSSAGAATTTASTAVVPVTADIHTTPQVDGVVYDIAILGTTAYAVGDFDHARPAGVAVGGAGEVVRHNVVAFNITTGAILSFAPSVTGTVTKRASGASVDPYCEKPSSTTYLCDAVFRAVLSTDKKRLYIAGDFTKVGTTKRTRVAAFTLSTGKLVAGFAPAPNKRVRALAVTSKAVFLGGNFTKVGKTKKARLAAVTTKGTIVKAFKASADREVWALAVGDKSRRLIVGGQFDKLTGHKKHGLGAVSTAKGAYLTWSSNIVPGKPKATNNYSWITDIIVSGSRTYVSSDGQGDKQFDGRAAFVTTTGKVVWRSMCKGASQSVALLKGVVYSASHSHDCSAVKTFTERTPMYYQRLVGETTAVHGKGTNGLPKPNQVATRNTTNGGPAANHFKNGPWTVATSAKGYLVVGGEFTTVNGADQQGLAVFAIPSLSANKAGPVSLSSPAARVVGDGRVRIAWWAAYDRDDAKLTYTVRRSDGTTVGTVTASSTFWSQPQLDLVDASLPASGGVTYTVTAADPDGNTLTSDASASVSASSTSNLPASGATAVTNGDKVLLSWATLAGGGTAEPNRIGMGTFTLNGTAAGATDATAPGGVSSSLVLPGTSPSAAWLNTVLAGPSTYTEEAWVKTTSKTGGAVVAFARTKTATSNTVDRVLGISTKGQATTYARSSTGAIYRITGGTAVNDGAWHHIASTLGSGGLKLYVDGKLVKTTTAVKSSGALQGYWHVGGAATKSYTTVLGTGWFKGTLGPVTIANKQLTAAAIAAEHTAH